MSTSDLQEEMAQSDSVMDNPVDPDSRLKNVEDKLDEVLLLLKDQVKSGLDMCQLQDENKKLKLRLQESEGTVAKLSKKVLTLEASMEDLKIHSMKTNLVFHNLPENLPEDCHSEVHNFMKDVLKIPEGLIFSKMNLSGDIRVDIAHRIGQQKGRPRPMVVTFVTRRGRDIVLSL